jgi:hypothetical protein
LNFSLTPAPRLTIRGSVTNLPQGAAATISLQSKDFNVTINGAEVHKDGSFEIRDVSPGAYTILASADNVPAPLIARQSLQIADSIDGLRLAPVAGGMIRGQLRLETNSTSRPDPSQMFLQLRSTDGDDDALTGIVQGAGFSPLANVNTDGSFSWKDVPPGHYSVELAEAGAMPDWYLKSVAIGSRDVSDAGFNTGSGIVTLEILANGKGAYADGIALDEKGEPSSDAVVVAVPEARFRSNRNRYRRVTTDQRGHFSLRRLPPGAYTVFAWESVEGEAYYNSEFLSIYEGQGKTIRLEEGDRAELQLRAIPEPDQLP